MEFVAGGEGSPDPALELGFGGSASGDGRSEIFGLGGPMYTAEFGRPTLRVPPRRVLIAHAALEVTVGSKNRKLTYFLRVRM